MSTRTLTTILPSDALYVSGTVNGVATTWTNTSGQTWETVAERSANDVYVVALTIINTVGTASETTFTLYYGLHLVTDRTQADVNYANVLSEKVQMGIATEEELAEWNSESLKGMYYASDLNRVGAAMLYVANRLAEQGYAPAISPKTDWLDTEWFTSSAAVVYLADLAELRKQFAIMRSTPGVPDDMVRLTYQEANNIEKILEDIDFLLTNAAKAWFFSGEVFSGEV